MRTREEKLLLLMQALYEDFFKKQARIIQGENLLLDMQEDDIYSTPVSFDDIHKKVTDLKKLIKEKSKIEAKLEIMEEMMDFITEKSKELEL
jgi:23S rRNA maturation mini-RNase III